MAAVAVAPSSRWAIARTTFLGQVSCVVHAIRIGILGIVLAGVVTALGAGGRIALPTPSSPEQLSVRDATLDVAAFPYNGFVVAADEATVYRGAPAWSRRFQLRDDATTTFTLNLAAFPVEAGPDRLRELLATQSGTLVATLPSEAGPVYLFVAVQGDTAVTDAVGVYRGTLVWVVAQMQGADPQKQAASTVRVAIEQLKRLSTAEKQ